MDHDLIYYGLTILLFLGISAFFSAAETAMTAISRARIYQLVMDNNKRAQMVSNLRRDKETLIGSVLLGNNAVNIAASAIATSLAIKIFGNDDRGLVIVTFVMTVLVVIFAEIIPKTYAIHNAERASLRLAAPLYVIVKILYPITFAIQFFVRGLFKLFGVDITKSNTLVSATDVIRGTIELHHREGKMIKQDRDMLGSILDLNDLEVNEIMIHRKEVETINGDLPAQALIDQAVRTMHSRVPVWRGEPDNIVGLLHVKNLMRMLGESHHRGDQLTREQILGACTRPWFIPDTTNLHSQLRAFRHKRQHFAFVVDEYGGWQGVVTLEDIIEEIVGNIDDEHDEAQTDIRWIAENMYEVEGNLPVRDLNRQLDWNLPGEDASTVAGLVIHAAETIPSVGEGFDIHGFRFTVLAKQEARVTRVRIEKLPDTMLPEDVEV